MASSRTAQKTKAKKYSWTQPCCMDCWNGLKLKIGRPHDNLTAEHHFCCHCRTAIAKGVTTYGLRTNPGSVPYPTVEKEQDE